MQFLLLADLHLGYRQYGMEGREQDFYKALSNVGDLAIAHHVDVVIAGDLFDTSKPPAAAVLALQKFVDRLRGNGLGVYAIEGNHDVTKGDYWLSVCGITSLNDRVVDVRGLRITGFNYGKAADIYAKIDQLESVDVVVTHAGFAEMQGDFASEFNIEEFAQKLRHTGCRVVANGHIHMWCQKEAGGITFIQPGSLEVKSVDEPLYKKAALVSVNGGVSVTALPYNTRPVIIKQIDTEEQFNEFLEHINDYAETLTILYVNREIEDSADRFNKAAEDLPTMWRFIPMDGAAKPAMERKTINSLAEAIEAYFEVDSPEYRLIARCLQTPENAANIALDYINNTEEKDDQTGSDSQGG